jgi:hypothetical protein
MAVCSVCVAFVAEKYALGALCPKCLAAAASLRALVVGVSALRQRRRPEVSAVRKFAGRIVAVTVCMLVGVRVWPVLGPGASQALSELPAYFTLKDAPAPEEAKDTGEAASATAPGPKSDTVPTVLPPVAPRPVFDVASLQEKCETWGQKAPRRARLLYAPDLKDEPAWIGDARELDYDITRSFESLKGKVDDKVHTSFATLSEKDKEYVDVIMKTWHRYEAGGYTPPYYDFNGVIVQIGSPNLNDEAINYSVSVLKTRIKKLNNLKAELAIVPGFSF